LKPFKFQLKPGVSTVNRVNQKVCAITGSALGIGRACALRLADEGAQLAIFDVLDEPGLMLAARARK
jgi:NAD(P)-dependent dehydrogenase (short-subunit alcohol dehydrogenase family)